MKRLRAIEFHVQPVVVVDDGKTLEPIQIQPLVIRAADWPTFATEQWPGALAITEAELNENEPETPRSGDLIAPGVMLANNGTNNGKAPRKKTTPRSASREKP